MLRLKFLRMKPQRLAMDKEEKKDIASAIQLSFFMDEEAPF